MLHLFHLWVYWWEYFTEVSRSQFLWLFFCLAYAYTLLYFQWGIKSTKYTNFVFSLINFINILPTLLQLPPQLRSRILSSMNKVHHAHFQSTWYLTCFHIHRTCQSQNSLCSTRFQSTIYLLNIWKKKRLPIPRITGNL